MSMKGNFRVMRSGGWSLMDVVLSMAIFAFGLLALLQLQGNLSRSSSDANERTVAVNLAEGIVEQMRAYKRMTVDPDGDDPAYEDFHDQQRTISRGGIDYTLDIDVTDYYYVAGAATDVTPVGRAHSDFKLVTLTVSWDSATFSQGDGETVGTLGSGSIKLTDVVSSSATVLSGRGLVARNLDATGPDPEYAPGSLPDVVAISLGDNRFKESTVPLPDVLRDDELVETKFDVVTYLQGEDAASFIRREEFRAVSCECTLNVPSSTEEGGYRPTVWDGSTYTLGEFVSKPYGSSASNQQSFLCDVCCRDHHDGGAGAQDDANDPGRSLYDPFKADAEYYDSDSDLDGNHLHYQRSATGALTLVDGDNDLYVEACRMVRKDGFFKLAQDLRQESLNNFTSEYIQTDLGSGKYSSYATDSVNEYLTALGSQNLYEDSPPNYPGPLEMSPQVVFPASVIEESLPLPDAYGNTSKQLQSRGIYLDYMSDKLRTAMACVNEEVSGDVCAHVEDITTVLEIVPFFDVQLTWLARWTETPNNDPVDVSNEAVLTDNAHSRGFASLGDGVGFSTINSSVHDGNLGLTATDPVDLLYTSHESDRDSYFVANAGSSSPPLSDVKISGQILSAVGGVKAADVEITATDAQCDRTNTGFECVLELYGSNPRITITNYQKSGKTLFGCSEVMEINGSEQGTTNWTRFNLPETSHSTADIVIKQNSCG